MKKALLFLLAALLVLLPACSPESPPPSYSARPDGCQIGETIVLNAPSWKKNVYHDGFDRPSGLCRDPLCAHDGANGPCPDGETMGIPRRFCTDGETLFMLAKKIEIGSPRYGIYAVDPAGVDPMRPLAETENAGTYGLSVFTADSRYLYYANSLYREGVDPNAETSYRGDQVLEIMRVPKNGGRAESVFGSLPVGVGFSVDEENYYLTHASDSGDVVCEIIPKRGGGSTLVPAPDGVRFGPLLYSEKGYAVFLCSAEPVFTTVTVTERIDRSAIAVIRDGRAFIAADDVSAYCTVFPYDGKIWFSPFYYEYEETKELPTGNGDETVVTDIYRLGDGTVFSLDPAAGERHRYRVEGGSLIGFSDGVPLGEGTDENGEPVIVRLTFTELDEG